MQTCLPARPPACLPGMHARALMPTCPLTSLPSPSSAVFKFNDPPLHDPCAVAYVIAPELFKVMSGQAACWLLSLLAGRSFLRLVKRCTLPLHVVQSLEHYTGAGSFLIVSVPSCCLLDECTADGGAASGCRDSLIAVCRPNRG